MSSVSVMRDSFLDALFEINLQTNLFSRKLNREQVGLLLDDHRFLYEKMVPHLSRVECFADIGSGNGILGIGFVCWVMDRGLGECRVHLVEPRSRKARALQEVVGMMGLKKSEVFQWDLMTYLGKKKEKKVILARGFPDNQLIVDQTKRKEVLGCGLVSSGEKIKGLVVPTDCGKSVAKIENRDQLNCLFLECFT